MEVHIFADAIFKQIPEAELNLLKPTMFTSTGNATKPETIARQREEAEADWALNVVTHPFANEVEHIVMLVVANHGRSNCVAKLFEGDCARKVMIDVSKFLRSEGHVGDVRWYGMDVEFTRKVVWSQCASAGLLRHAPQLDAVVLHELLYGCPNFELQKLLELRTNLVTDYGAASTRVVPGDGLLKYFRDYSLTQAERMRAVVLFTYDCFACAGGVPTLESVISDGKYVPLLDLISTPTKKATKKKQKTLKDLDNRVVARSAR